MDSDVSSLPTGPTPQIAGQDETHARNHALLTRRHAAALLQEQPALNGFRIIAPARPLLLRGVLAGSGDLLPCQRAAEPAREFPAGPTEAPLAC
ncbi:hypothetical protein [Brachybacterium sacelli]|uniref:hypothetical protein n=1 Tax=Brachybacterium sacelli TaxID=173364 RepID=UPI003618ADDF